MMIPKTTTVRLKGVPLKKLVESVYKRDNNCCAVCGRWVENGHKPHHVIPKSHGGGDTLENLVLLCDNCHYEVHHGKLSGSVKGRIQNYMDELKAGGSDG